MRYENCERNEVVTLIQEEILGDSREAYMLLAAMAVVGLEQAKEYVKDREEKIRKMFIGLPNALKRGVIKTPFIITPDCKFDHTVSVDFDDSKKLVLDENIDFEKDAVNYVVDICDDNDMIGFVYEKGVVRANAYFKFNSLNAEDLERILKAICAKPL